MEGYLRENIWGDDVASGQHLRDVTFVCVGSERAGLLLRKSLCVVRMVDRGIDEYGGGCTMT